MSAAQIIGLVIVVAFFGGLYVMTGITHGWLASTIIWAGSILAVAILTVGLFLLTGAWPE